MKVFRPLFLIISLLLITGLACSFGGRTTKPTDEPTDEPIAVTVPTAEEQEPTPQEEPTEEEQPTEEPASTEAEAYFTETFDGSLDNYTYFNTGKGDAQNMKLENDNGYLIFDLNDKNLWIYVTYNAFTYKDVALEVVAENHGKDSYNVSLFCRYDPDEGWYEFSVTHGGLYGGLYDIYAYDATGAVRKGYTSIFNGASEAIKQGKDIINTYSVSCIGDKLTLSINGTEVKTIRDTKYKFREGKVGFSVSSFNVTPILVNVDSFTISEP